jgi:predicted permease
MVAAIGSFVPLSDAWKRRIVPALQAVASVKSSRWLVALVVVQMAFVTAVTCSAALLWRSFRNLAAIRPAMDTDRRILLVRGYWDGVKTPAARADALLAELSALPGVRHAAYARRALLSGSGGGASIDLELPNQPKLSFFYDQVSPSYFATTGARIVSGRGFTASDGHDTTPVVMVNEAFVRRFNRQPLGAWIKIGGKQRLIVGVVEDGPTNHLKERIEPYFYFSFAQMAVDYLTFFVETGGDPEALTSPVRARTRRVDSAFTLTGMNTLRQHMFAARKDDAVLTAVSAGLALLGLVLAAAGLFGVTSYAVSRRVREFGLRVALGATGADLRRQVLKSAALQAAVGIPIGWAMALAGRQWIQSFLFGVSASNVWVLAGASALVAAVALLAALRPAMTAAHVDPMVALRYD